MIDQGAALVIVVLAVLTPLDGTEGFAKRLVEQPAVVRIQQMQTLAQCEQAAQRWREDLEEVPVPGRTVRVLCLVP